MSRLPWRSTVRLILITYDHRRAPVSDSCSRASQPLLSSLPVPAARSFVSRPSPGFRAETACFVRVCSRCCDVRNGH
jgi:hypothetical protein